MHTTQTGGVPPTKKYCSKHNGREQLFVCFDPRCSKDIACCVLCVKNNHTLCNDDFIIQRSAIAERVFVTKTDSSDMDSFKNQIREILEEARATMNKKFDKYLSQTIDFLGSESVEISADMDLEILQGLKRNQNITVKDDDTIEISPKFDPSKPQIKQDLEVFRGDLDKFMQQFEKEINRVKYYTSGVFDSNIFEIHEKISNKQPTRANNLQKSRSIQAD